MKNKWGLIKAIIFLVCEAVMFAVIMNSNGKTLMASEYISIILCGVYAIFNIKGGEPFIIAGMCFTVGADYFLVTRPPSEWLWGMLIFLAVQLLYACAFINKTPKQLLIIRAILSVGAVITAVVVLKEAVDLLSVVSVLYYANLITNIICAFSNFKSYKLFAPGLVLFILCDTVIGLQAAIGNYLDIGADTLLYKIAFMDFNLAWLFYLPAQVLIALSTGKMIKRS